MLRVSRDFLGSDPPSQEELSPSTKAAKIFQGSASHSPLLSFSSFLQSSLVGNEPCDWHPSHCPPWRAREPPQA